MNTAIILDDMFHFDGLLAQPENKCHRVKLRFNKNWGKKDNRFTFSDDYRKGKPICMKSIF